MRKTVHKSFEKQGSVIFGLTSARHSHNHNIGRIDSLSYWFDKDPWLLGKYFFYFCAVGVSCAVADRAVSSQLVAESNSHASSANNADLHFDEINK
jgi:hypothetical protein